VDKKNVKLILAYDGSRYHGWQRQHNGISIQEVLEEKLKTMLGTQVKLIASGRTDAGVHAINQVCNFITRSDIQTDAIRKGLNSLLPDDIHVKAAEYVPAEFHSRYSAKSKIYEYRILNRPSPDVFLRHYLWHIRMPLDIEEMNKCLFMLKGTHDFSSFKSSGSNNKNPVRSISRAELHRPANDDLLRIIIEADGFLRHMVRNIVGTVAETGMGKISADEFRKILDSKDRGSAGIKAPARGLFLLNVRY
jgi:tRNA pseudouridine38-40 synthase